LFARLAETGSQVWMTGTEEGLFDSVGPDAMCVRVADGTLD
jgi:hypothetical protein